jgi:GNAT superfamily N-acetyltransferase
VHRVANQHPHWIAPLWLDRRDYLDHKKNPFFQHATVAGWIARRDGTDIGRIAAVHDIDWEKAHHEKAAYFGFFDCIDDQAVATALLDRAAHWARSRGCALVYGPFDLSTNYQAGLLIDGYDDDPCVYMPWNPPYYATLLEGAAFAKRKDLFQWWLGMETDIPEKVARVADKVKERSKVVIRSMDLDRWDEEVDRVLAIYNDAWEDNWGFVPMADAEFRHLAKDLKMVLKPELALMAEVDGEPIAFCITILNINEALKELRDGKLLPFGALKLSSAMKRIEKLRLIVMGIRSGYRRRGADSILFVETHRAAKKLGMKGGEIGWTLEDNDMVNRAIEAMDGKKVKTYRVYARAL